MGGRRGRRKAPEARGKLPFEICRSPPVGYEPLRARRGPPSHTRSCFPQPAFLMTYTLAFPCLVRRGRIPSSNVIIVEITKGEINIVWVTFNGHVGVAVNLISTRQGDARRLPTHPHVFMRKRTSNRSMGNIYVCRELHWYQHAPPITVTRHLFVPFKQERSYG